MELMTNTSRSLFWLIGFLLLLLLISGFSNDFIEVDIYDGSVFWVRSTWWGLSKEYKEIFWMQAEGYDSPGWMTRAKDGSFYYAIVEENPRRDYDY